ncbi:MAG: flagellar assembly protein FliW [Gallionella sp.]
MSHIKLNTRFGELSVEASKIITFSNGIPGFENCTRWTLFHELNELGEPVSGVVVHLQSLDDESVSLAMTEPNLFGFNYELELSDSEEAELKFEDASDVLVLMALYQNSENTQDKAEPSGVNIFANLSAPILINTKAHIGLQKALFGSASKVNFRTVVNL